MNDPRLLVILITYNRLEYTKKTIRAFWDTVEVPYYLVVVDNNSSDGTQEYLKGLEKRGRIDKLILNPENYYPGKACNIGWTAGMQDYPEARFLMRLDNDMHLEKGWDIAALEYFKKIPSMGQIGIEHEAIENERAQGYNITLNGKTFNTFPGNVGGPNIISRLVWEKGCRYDESPWTADDPNVPQIQEDWRLSQAIKLHGFLVGHMTEKLAWTFANEHNWKEYPEYYRETMTKRGYTKLINDVLEDAA
jgi:glycosyltransferase involved in cell wall biosynthesis